MSYTWKIDYFSNKGADANKVGAEIETLGDNFTTTEMIAKARNESSSMHTLFEWNDDIAAEKFRENQARNILCNLVFKVDEVKKEDAAPVRVFVSNGEHKKEYVPIKTVVKVEDKYQELLNQAYADLRAFKLKYSSLRELDYILELIE